QTFNRTAASTGTVQLTLASLGLLIPAGFVVTLHTADAARRTELGERVSLIVAGLLILSFLLGLLFRPCTDRHLYRGRGGLSRLDQPALHDADGSALQPVRVDRARPFDPDRQPDRIGRRNELVRGGAAPDLLRHHRHRFLPARLANLAAKSEEGFHHQDTKST